MESIIQRRNIYPSAELPATGPALTLAVRLVEDKLPIKCIIGTTQEQKTPVANRLPGGTPERA